MELKELVLMFCIPSGLFGLLLWWFKKKIAARAVRNEIPILI